MERKRVKDINIKFNGSAVGMHITIPKKIYQLIDQLVQGKKFKSPAEFLKEAAAMSLYLFYKIESTADITSVITNLIETGEFANISQFFDWAARWKLIQLHQYPEMDHIAYALRMWFGGGAPQ